MSFALGNEIELHIDRLSYDGGRGVGRVDGFVFFVAATAPDELVRAQITELKKNFGEARLIEVIKSSVSRRQPECPVASACGGCVWQHISYVEQLKQKQMILGHQLKGAMTTDTQVKPIVASPSEFRYRNRVQIHLEANKITSQKNASRPVFGFFEKGTNSIVETKDCLISDEKLFAKLDSDPDFIEVIKQFKMAQPGQRSQTGAQTVKVELAITESGSRVIRPLATAESEFSQVNTPLNALLQRYVVDKLVENKPLQHIYDLYCGSGNLSFPIIAAFQNSNFTGVELNASAIDRAVSRNVHEKAHFQASAVHKFLKRLKSLPPRSAIVLDPPRAGLEGGVIDQLLRLQPELILYVSCSLPTLARDLKKFHDYRVVSVQGFDMFPQTEYLETVVVLTR